MRNIVATVAIVTCLWGLCPMARGQVELKGSAKVFTGISGVFRPELEALGRRAQERGAETVVYAGEFARAGSDWITVHVEAAHHLHRTVGQIREAGCRAGVSLNPATPLVQVEEILPDLDLLLVMSVNPGFGGQRFIDGALPRIRRAKEMIAAAAPRVLLEVDGGVTVDNIGAIAQAGADVLVAGAAIFGSPDYARTIAAMKTRAA